jgi:hypothetical protein
MYANPNDDIVRVLGTPHDMRMEASPAMSNPHPAWVPIIVRLMKAYGIYHQLHDICDPLRKRALEYVFYNPHPSVCFPLLASIQRKRTRLSAFWFSQLIQNPNPRCLRLLLAWYQYQSSPMMVYDSISTSFLNGIIPLMAEHPVCFDVDPKTTRMETFVLK